MIKSRKIVLVGIFFVVLIIISSFLKVFPPLELSIILKCEIHQSYQVFYDMGNEYTEKDSRSIHVHKTEKTSTVHFKLPAKEIRKIRFDPGNKAVAILIESVCLQSLFKKYCWTGPELIQIITPFRHIANINFNNNHVEIISNGDDPILLFTGQFDDILKLLNKKIKKIYLYFLSFFLAVLLLVFLHLQEKVQIIISRFIKKPQLQLFIGKLTTSKLLDYSTNFYIIILTAVALVIPSYSSSVFSGIPLKTKAEFFVFLFLISFLLGLILIKRLSFTFDKKIILFSTPVVIVIFLKIFLFVQTTDHPPGFQACYRSIINKLPDGQCEFSFDNFLKYNKKFTRYDEIIEFDTNWNETGDFDSDWKLGFWDEGRFNLYQTIKGNQIRERNPFEVTWKGNILIPYDSEAELNIKYTGEVKLQIGDNFVSLPTKYQTKNTFLVNINEVLLLDLKRQNNELVLPIKIYYRFQDFSKLGMDKNTLGPNSNISVKLITKNEGTTHLKSYSNKNLKSKILALLIESVITLLILVIVISHLVIMYKESNFLFTVYLLGGVIILFSSQSYYLRLINFFNSVFKTSVFFFIVVTVGYFISRKKRVLYFFISFLFFTQLYIYINADLEKVLYRSPGNDPMTYESLSRSIGKAENIADFLHGGREVFHFQPFIRYYLAFNHILLGDGNYSVFIFHKFLFLFTIPFIFLFFSKRLKFIPALVFSLAFVNILYNFVFGFMHSGLSEYPAWLFLIMAVYLLFCNRSHSGYFIGFALLGFASITRINFIPGILYLILVFYIHYLLNSNGDKARKKKYGVIFYMFFSFYWNLLFSPFA